MHPFQDAVISRWVHAERTFVDEVDAPFRRTGVFVLGEGVAVVVAQRIQHKRFAVDVHGLAVHVVEGTHVVDAAGVVLVVMSEQDGVQVADILCKHLGTEVGAGVHQDGEAVHVDECSAAEALVPRVGAAAGRAVAADDGNAL